jgi:hypothetical protein
LTVLLISTAVAFAVAVVALRRAPLAAVLGICALAAAVHAGAVSLPGAITGPVDRASAAVRGWQTRQSAKLVCATVEARALESDDVAMLRSLDASCAPTSR